MSKLKEVIKDVTDLEQAIDTVLQETTQVLNDAIGHLYPEYKRALRSQLVIGMFLLFLFCGVIFVIFSPQLFPNPNAIYAFAGLVFVVCIVGEVLYAKKKYNFVLHFNQQFKEIAMPYIGSLFGLKARLLYAGPRVMGYATRNDKRTAEIKLIRERIAQAHRRPSSVINSCAHRNICRLGP